MTGPGGVPAGYLDGALLAVLAWLLTCVVPGRLAVAGWTARVPRAALALWSAVGLAAGLSTVGSLLSLGLAPLGGHLLANLVTLAGQLAGGQAPLLATVPAFPAAPSSVLWVPASAGVVLLGWQVLVLARCLASLAAHRRAHRDLLDVVGTWEESLGSVVLEDPRLLAYHLPGLRDSRVVLTRGCVDRTGRAELTAVLAHERAHAAGHHHVLTEPFIAWERTFPFLGPARRATAAVVLLTEMLADDAAARAAGPAATLAALHRVGCGTRGTPGAATVARMGRLHAGHPAPGPAVTAAVYAAAVAVLVAPTVLLSLP